jgi:penicillin V acylase-like amidase (Ntn superfamily)
LTEEDKGVREVIDSDSLVRVSATGKGPMTHMLVSDRTGAAAVIEFIDGKRIVYTGDSMPVRALSNTPTLSSASSRKTIERKQASDEAQPGPLAPARAERRPGAGQGAACFPLIYMPVHI